jgi:hypothetical protein
MKMYQYLDAHRLDFFHRFSSVDMVSGVRFQVSEKAEVLVYPYMKLQGMTNEDCRMTNCGCRFARSF